MDQPANTCDESIAVLCGDETKIALPGSMYGATLTVGVGEEEQGTGALLLPQCAKISYFERRTRESGPNVCCSVSCWSGLLSLVSASIVT